MNLLFFLDLSSTLTITRGRKPGLGFVRKMLKWGYVINEKSGFFVDAALFRLAKTRCHVIYTDPALNRKSVIYLNIYQNFLVAAMKMHCYLREWRPGWHEQRTSLVCSPSLQPPFQLLPTRPFWWEDRNCAEDDHRVDALAGKTAIRWWWWWWWICKESCDLVRVGSSSGFHHSW